nr:uncharacterized protein LOC120974077 [Aegilops tauschii subsp. strangulata]
MGESLAPSPRGMLLASSTPRLVPGDRVDELLRGPVLRGDQEAPVRSVDRVTETLQTANVEEAVVDNLEATAGVYDVKAGKVTRADELKAVKEEEERAAAGKKAVEKEAGVDDVKAGGGGARGAAGKKAVEKEAGVDDLKAGKVTRADELKAVKEEEERAAAGKKAVEKEAGAASVAKKTASAAAAASAKKAVKKEGKEAGAASSRKKGVVAKGDDLGVGEESCHVG